MKKSIIFGLWFAFVACHSSGHKPTPNSIGFEYYENDTIQKLLTAIVRTDSTKTDCHLIFKSFDNRDSIVTEFNFYQCQNDTRAEYLSRSVYDRQGKLVLRETFNMEGSKLNTETY